MSDNVSEAFQLRQKYKHFRILVIGRANAGKTTILKRVCNAKEHENPFLYNEEMESLQLEPTQDRGHHNIQQAFAFKSNPEFIFHDSPGFEKGDESQLQEVQKFIEKCAKATEVKDQLHAIWFCVVTDSSRPLLDLEKKFFADKIYGNVPLIAIFTKFDDFINQVTNPRMPLKKKRELAKQHLETDFEQPLSDYKLPKKAMLCLEGMPLTLYTCCYLSAILDMHKNGDKCQKQVKELMEKTAESLDSLALKLLFVSVQKNNIELAINYAIKK
ncbi:hypothetical protein K435DRAFT_762570 [Dendrothele bispora CBS 962.96]|uniref:G domain-containing protein n=1 Tax=Dendrothele bispora (strain CBS 962.96) TaxID=1314807 RepID=A0A4V4HDJ9_DENBC|nr:hypothetical protein K435DRAFT_762570 [Dendrothele bispora CBS 962.96]